MFILNWWSSDQQELRTGRRRGQWVAFVSRAKPHIELKALPPPSLCRHLDSIGFSRAGKSNASFKTNCFLLDQLFLSLMCNSFTPSWTHTARGGRSDYDVGKHAVEHSLPSNTEHKHQTRCVGFDKRANYVWLCNYVSQKRIYTI